MKRDYSFSDISRSRIATFDTFSVGIERHHIAAILEFDVTDSRRKLQELRRKGVNVSFNAWILKVISSVVHKHPEAAAFLYNKKRLIVFDDINISVIIEKKINNNRVPIPVLIEKTNDKSAGEITAEIEKAVNQPLKSDDIVLNKKSTRFERFYYSLPGFLRRTVWRIMLRNPKFLFPKMGNVVITPVGMMGKINGWFIHKSIHPLSIGVGSILKKPVVVGNDIKIREILNMTILVDHDVIDGAPMVRFLNDLTRLIEDGEHIYCIKCIEDR